MSTRGGRIDTGFATSRSRYLGGMHLIAAGVVNLAIAIVVASSIGSESGFQSLLTVLELWWSESRLLEHGGLLAVVLDVVVPAVATVALLVGLVQIGAGAAAVAGRRYRNALVAAAVGAVTIVTIPLCAIAAFLLWCSRDQFSDAAPDDRP